MEVNDIKVIILRETIEYIYFVIKDDNNKYRYNKKFKKVQFRTHLRCKWFTLDNFRISFNKNIWFNRESKRFESFIWSHEECVKLINKYSVKYLIEDEGELFKKLKDKNLLYYESGRFYFYY